MFMLSYDRKNYVSPTPFGSTHKFGSKSKKLLPAKESSFSASAKNFGPFFTILATCIFSYRFPIPLKVFIGKNNSDFSQQGSWKKKRRIDNVVQRLFDKWDMCATCVFSYLQRYESKFSLDGCGAYTIRLYAPMARFIFVPL